MTSFFRKRVNSLLRTSRWSISKDSPADAYTDDQDHFKKGKSCRYEEDKTSFVTECILNGKNGKKISTPEIYSGKTGLDLPVIHLDVLSLQVKASFTGPDGGLTRVREQREQPIVNMANLDDEFCLSVDEISLNEWNDEPMLEKIKCSHYREAHLESLGFVPGNVSPINTSNEYDWNRYDDKKAYGGSVSLYEKHPITGVNAGNPIADVFGIIARENNCVLALADGVNWGEGAQLAARCGVRGALDHINKHIESGKFQTSTDVFHSLLGAFHAGHALILQEGGALTTLCVALVVPVKNSSTSVLCVCNVGDSLCFVQNPLSGVREITLASHDISLMRDMRDAGGALGPVDGRNPQLHNLTCSMTFVEEGDIVYITSDGVSDNFDPVVGKFCTIKKTEEESEKLTPSPNFATTITNQIKNTIQNSVPPMLKKIPPRCNATLPCVDANQRHELMLLRMADIAVNGSDKSSNDDSDMIESDINQVTAKSLCKNFLEFVYNLTTVKRKTLEDPELYRVRNTHTRSEERIRRRLIKDMISQMPGKLDHSSIVAYKVGDWDGYSRSKIVFETGTTTSSGISSGSSQKSSVSPVSSTSSREEIDYDSVITSDVLGDCHELAISLTHSIDTNVSSMKTNRYSKESIDVTLIGDFTAFNKLADITPTICSPYEQQSLFTNCKPPSGATTSRNILNKENPVEPKERKKHRRNSLSRHTLGIDVSWFKKLIISNGSDKTNELNMAGKSTNISNSKVFLILAILGVYCFYDFYWKRKSLPPGPVPWLIAGNMPQLLLHIGDVDAIFQCWKNQYGGIFTIWIGPIPMVMVADVEIMKNYFVKNADVFSDRWVNYITDTFMEGFNGIVQIHGDKWREQRRFSLHVLRDFGVGRAEIEKRVMLEVERMIECLEKDAGNEAIDLHSYFAACVGNIIITILFGKRYEHDDPVFIELRDLLERQTQVVIRPVMGLYCVAPFTTKIPLINSSWKELMGMKKFLNTFLRKEVTEHLAKFDPSAEPTDFTFAYLKEMHERKASNGDMGYFSEKQLEMLLLDLFFAGMETTVTTLKWGFLNLILNPDEQKVVQTAMCDLPNIVKMEDKNHLLYLQAMMNEIQRVANILPFNLLRTTSTTVSIDGYTFKKGTMVLPMISIVMNDPFYFENPKKFDPSRFIDNNNGIKKYDGFLPFSVGRRSCLGESLAKAELFLVISNILKNFDLSIDPAKPMPSTKRILGLTCSPQKYKVLLTRRNL
uniref:PPM-type phosphatase domain-containing protein n=1 Tax=Rhabditophanes sp. KR3021 TaxID=114890 RepID=A0AC35TKY6_9BILA